MSRPPVTCYSIELDRHLGLTLWGGPAVSHIHNLNMFYREKVAKSKTRHCFNLQVLMPKSE